MKKIILVLAMLFLAVNVVSAKDYIAAKKAGGYDVVMAIDKNPPVVGNNNVTIFVKDASGKNVTDAKVVVDYSMPAMPGMPPMNYKTDAELKGSEYKAVMNLSMAGPWTVAVKVSKAGKTVIAKFSIDAR